MKTIEITVTPTGETTVQTKGFRGQGCKAASDAMEKALGAVKRDKSTPEMYQTEQAKGSLWNSQ